MLFKQKRICEENRKYILVTFLPYVFLINHTGLYAAAAFTLLYCVKKIALCLCFTFHIRIYILYTNVLCYLCQRQQRDIVVIIGIMWFKLQMYIFFSNYSLQIQMCIIFPHKNKFQCWPIDNI